MKEVEVISSEFKDLEGDEITEIRNGRKAIILTPYEHELMVNRIKELSSKCSEACELGKTGLIEQKEKYERVIQQLKNEYEEVIPFAIALGFIIGFLLSYAIFK